MKLNYIILMRICCKRILDSLYDAEILGLVGYSGSLSPFEHDNMR